MVPVSFCHSFSTPWFEQFSQNDAKVIFIFSYSIWQRFEKSRSKQLMELLVINCSFTQFCYLNMSDILVRSVLGREMLVSNCGARVLTCNRNTLTRKAPEKISLLSNVELENLFSLKSFLHTTSLTQEIWINEHKRRQNKLFP